MRRVEILREQARVLRDLSKSFELPQIKEELLFLAERCDRLAAIMVRETWERLQQPISGKRSLPDGV